MINLITAALLTVFAETAFLLVMGYRDKTFIAVCMLINLATNLSINLLLSAVPLRLAERLVYPAELAVVVVEWAVLRLFCRGGWKLPVFVLLANILSYCLGLALFGPL